MTYDPKFSQFLNVLDHVSKSERRSVIRSVVDNLDEGDIPAIDPLIEALSEDDPYFRVKAAKGLGIVRGSHAVTPLVFALNDFAADVRVESAKSLGLIGDPRAVEPLCLALTDIDNKVKMEAAIALGLIKDPSSLNSLCKAIKDNNDQVLLRYLDEAIIKIDPNVLQSLDNNLNKTEDEKLDIREINYFLILINIIKLIKSIIEKSEDLNILKLLIRDNQLTSEYYKHQVNIDYSDITLNSSIFLNMYHCMQICCSMYWNMKKVR